MTARLDAALAELAEAIRAEVRAEAAPLASAPDRLYSITATCEALGGIGRSMVYDLIARGELRTIKSGRRRLVTADAISAYINVKAGRSGTGEAA